MTTSRTPSSPSRDLAAVAFLALPAASLWMAGAGTLGPRRVLSVVVLGLTAAWAVALVIERRRPAVPWPVLAVAALPVVVAGVLSLAPTARYDAEMKTFVPIESALPGPVDAGESHQTLLVVTAAVATLALSADATAGRPAVARGSALVTAVNAALLTLVALAMKTGLIPPPAGEAAWPASRFAVFAYHGNAASYLLATLAISVAAARATRGGAATLAWTCAALIGLGLAINVSKAGLFLAPAVAVAALLVTRKSGKLSTRNIGLGVTILIAVLAVGLAAAHLAGGLDRLRDFAAKPTSASARLIVWNIAANIWADRPILGHGPGSFKLLLPVSDHFDPALYPRWIVTHYEPGTVPTIWSYACNDYLQGGVEWGLLGVACFGVVLIGAVVRGIRVGTPLAGGLAVAVLALLVHALIDSPLQIPCVELLAAASAGILWAWPNSDARPAH